MRGQPSGGLGPELQVALRGAAGLGGLLIVLALLGPISRGEKPPTVQHFLGASALWSAHTLGRWLWIALGVLVVYIVIRVVLEVVRWTDAIPKMAEERVAYAVLAPHEFAPILEAIAHFSAALVGVRRRVPIKSWLDRPATAFCVGLTTDQGGRPLMYWEFPKRFEAEVRGALGFYPGVVLEPLDGYLPEEPSGKKTVVRRLELHPGKPERFPLQELSEKIDALQNFASQLANVKVEEGDRLHQRVLYLPVPPGLISRVRRQILTKARGQEVRDSLATVNSFNDRFNPAENVDRRMERGGLWAKVGKAEPMFRTTILIRSQASDSERAAKLATGLFGAWDMWAGQNYMRSVGIPVLGGLAILFGSNSLLRRPWFDYRWRTGVVGASRVLTSWETWPMFKPFTKYCRVTKPSIVRRDPLAGLQPPPESVDARGRRFVIV